MRARIKNKQEITGGTLLVEFDLMGQTAEFIPGQYMAVNLINPPYLDEKGSRRNFSIVNSPNQKILSFATRLRDSAFKKSIQQLPIGTEVEIGPISGKFTLPEDVSKNYVFIAGGIGITPFMSMLRYIKEENLSYKITLIYSNRDQDSTAYLEELRTYHPTSTTYRLILTMTDDPGWNGEKRMVDETFLKQYLGDLRLLTFMVVGPPLMVEAIVKILKEQNVPEENIKIESFTGY